MAVERVPFEPLRQAVMQRARRQGVYWWSLIEPGRTRQEWDRSALRQAWYRAQRDGTITHSMLDTFCTKLEVRPNDIGYPNLW